MRLLSDVGGLLETLQTEWQVLENFHRGKQWPRRPNAAHLVDVMEMFAGTMPFTLGCGCFGLTALEPQDLWTGWDYHREWDYQRTLELARFHHPRLIVAGVECTPWCWFNVAVTYKHRPEELAALQRLSLVSSTCATRSSRRSYRTETRCFWRTRGSQQ